VVIETSGDRYMVEFTKEAALSAAGAIDRTASLDSFLLGAATGGRTSAGLAALAWTGEPDTIFVSPRPLHWFQLRLSKSLQTAALVGELIADKLPSTPSRLRPGSLVARTATGSTAAAALAQRNGSNVAQASVLGAGGAIAGSLLGASWRALVAKRRVPDLGPAILEDAISVALALFACRPKAMPDVIDLTTQPATSRRRNPFAAQPHLN
jgi:uncharacterized membrane protein